MKLLKRGLCLLIALVTVSTLAACGKKTNNGGVTGDPDIGKTEYELDFSDRNYEGHEFRVLRVDAERQHNVTGHPNDIFIEEAGGDSLASAVWTRNQSLSQMLNVTVSMKMEHTGAQLGRFLQQVVYGGDVYDLVIQEMEHFPTLVNQGLVKDMNELNMDTTYSWWDSAAEESFNLSGKQYAMISDIIYLDKLSTVGVFYNTVMAAKLDLPDMFDMVDDGEWTYEKMKEFAIMASESGENIYGISCQNDASYYFLHAANIKTVVKNADGELSFNLYSRRPVNVLETVFTLMNEDYFYNRQLDNLTVDETVKMFESQNLFLVRTLQTFYYLKNYCDTYGVLPMPKMDSLTDGYYSTINYHLATVIAVPLNNSENARTADVLQAWGMISQKSVMPELYDRILSARMVNDPDSSRMIGIILQNRVYDIGLIWNFGSMEDSLVLANKIAIQRAPGTIGSTLATLKPKVEDDIAKYMG